MSLAAEEYALLREEIYLPSQVLEAIRGHVETAVEHAESGYSSAQEEEDTLTGEFGGALRTKKVQIVHVTEGQVPGIWRWSITYSKFRSKAKNATEFVIGADGILEIRVGSIERDQRKSALFQAKNSKKHDPRLVEQCAKMSVWREASFVISYSAEGYSAYAIDDILLSGGSIARAGNGIPLAQWIIGTFIGCQVGRRDLHYDKNERKLYWMREPTSERESGWDRWVWVDFRPKHLIHIDVTPPDWERSQAVEIAQDKISLNRLAFTPEDLFGIEPPFTLAQLRKRKNELLHVYHSDKNHHLPHDLRWLLDRRVIEINQAYSKLSESIITERRQSNTQRANKSAAGLEGPRNPTVDELLKKRRTAEKVRVRQNKKG